MRLYIASDLHLEFGQPWMPRDIDYDVLVLAGDIHKSTKGFQLFKGWMDRPVIYVSGNHEFYGQVMSDVITDFRRLARKPEFSNTYFLERDAAVIGDVRFLGTTLWTDFRLFGDEVRDQAMAVTEAALNDFRLISTAPRRGSNDRAAQTVALASAEIEGLPRPNVSRPLTAAYTVKLFEKSLVWLESELAKPFPGKTVVVTHHLPAWGSVAPRFQQDLVSAGFASDLSDLILRHQPSLWIHGHTHDAFDYWLGNTRVICNPRGYPRELGTRFRSDLVVEV